MQPMQKISIYYAQLSHAEKTVCDLVLKNPQVIVENPIAEAAKIYQVSPSSILRMTKKIGYKGYSEFRYALENAVNQSQLDQHRSRVSHIIEMYKSILQELEKAIDERKIQQFVEELKTKKFYTVGIGNSSLPAKQMVYVLYPFENWGECIDDSLRIDFLVENLKSDHLVIFFSVTGSLETYKKMYKKCRNQGVKTALITMNSDEKLYKMVDYCFVLPSLPIAFIDSSQNSRYLDNRSLFFIFIEIVMSYYLAKKS